MRAVTKKYRALDTSPIPCVKPLQAETIHRRRGNLSSGAGSDLFDAGLLPVANVPENIVTARTGYSPGGPGDV